VVGGLLAVFYALDRYMLRRAGRDDPEVLPEIEKLGLEGGANLALLAAVVAVVLLRGLWQPPLGLDLWGVHWGAGAIAADALLLAIALLSVRITPAALRRANQFSWNPMIEVAILFAGIFATIVPVMAMIAAGGEGPAAPLLARLFAEGRPADPVFYWATGALSAVLDNAPTYLVFFGFAGGDPARLAGELARTLAAISAGAVFFGAMTYIGNAPNLLVRAIVESQGVRMPSFFGYVGWALVCLLPWLAVVDLIFFR
jgi:Na+/H+ antiporter NhaD/arsenite permease-like protein